MPDPGVPVDPPDLRNLGQHARLSTARFTNWWGFFKGTSSAAGASTDRDRREPRRSFDGPPGDPDTPGGWWIIDDPELHFGADVLVPDLAGWHRERMPSFPDTPAVTLAPDSACEILSPTTATPDRTRKMPAYALNGVAHLWLIDPTARTLEVYRLEGERWMVASSHGGSTNVDAEPFAAIEIDMRRWWGER